MTSDAASVIATPDPFTEIRLLTLHSLRGANYWSRRPITRMDLQIGAYEDISSADAPWLTDQLVAAMPGLMEHRCSYGRRGGFVERLRDGTYAAHIIEHIALELQSMVGHDVGYGRTRGTGDVGGYTVVVEHAHEAVGLRSAALALEAVQRAFANMLDTVNGAVAELRALAATPDLPPLRHRVLCAVTGGSGRAEARTELAALGIGSERDDEQDPECLVIEVSPSYLLQAGLPYAHSDIAVVLDTDPIDVPARYRDPERAARLMATVADAVPRHGIVVCPASAHLVHDLVRDAERKVRRFDDTGDPMERARAAAQVAADALAAATR